ncbi:MAG: gliding motility protein GldM, partial [Bacteroidales bacterium]|nr:gliding motility protein GldM [Bacteroidales bacterium]
MAQPRLVPRQRMINMMYLVLTALLALNVSKETLDVIAKVDKSLNQTIENFASKNNLTYADFEKAYTLNPVKTGPWKFKADSVRIKSQELVDKITQYKWAIVRVADGKKARLDSIKNMENLNIPAQVMLVDQIESNGKKMSRAKDLRNSIEAYRGFLLNMIDPSDTVLITSVKKALEIVDPPGTLREPNRTWQQDNFEYLPLIGVITILTKLQSDVRNAESDVLNYLYQGIEKESFKFNELRAVVIPKTSNYIFKGSPYEAEVFLSAFDTTLAPDILVGGKPLPIHDGRGIFKTIGNKTGKFKWGGIINYTTPDGNIVPYRFESEYEVSPPSLVVSPTKMNVFFNGLANPVEISVPGVPANRISASMTHGQIKLVSPGKFEVFPSTDQGIAVVTAYAMIDGQKRNMGSRPFRLRRVPDPVAMVNNQQGGPILKNILLAQTG